MDHFCFELMSCVCHAFTSVHCRLLVTCWERAGLLPLVCDVKSEFVTFHVVSWVKCVLFGLIPDLCRLSYFH